MNLLAKFFIAVLVILFSSVSAQEINSYKANVFIGTGGHGHTFPGATLPFGMVQLSPDTRLTGWDGCSGYHFSDSIVYGFSHTHLSGTGVSDYGDILLLPIQGKIKRYERNKVGSHFNHEKENANPGFYHIYLEDYNVNVDLTTSDRCGFHRYTFNDKAEAKILLDLKHRDFVKDSGIKIVGKNQVEGFRYSSAWAKDQRIYFVLQFSKDFKSYDLNVNGKINNNLDIKHADSIKVFFNFDLDDNRQILVKVGISSVDIEGAKENLKKELKNWNFDEVLKSSDNKWQKQLDKIQVFGGNKDDKTIFYSALYHLSIVPNLFSDIDGRYRGLDGKIYENQNHDTYTVFSLWDTYRAAHPLYTLIEPERTSDFINTFINHSEQTGILPVWELGGNETNCMIGIHSIPVISDAIVKKIKGFDYYKAYKAMKNSINQNKEELNHYRDNSFISAGEIRESVSKTLEYAFDDWSIAKVAKSLGEIKDYKKYIRRSQNYKNVFDPNTHFMRPRQNGGWRTPFNAKEVDFNYTEANSWQYSFYVPQDIEGLIKLMGGKQTFINKLDTLFHTTSITTGRHQADITGLIGQYAHGNEPSHHMAYLYSYAGVPWKTQKIVHRIMKEMYQNNPNGLSGNEDCGQMSAWYVFSAMGFYPVCPGSNDYILGTPKFDSIAINLADGNSFQIVTKNRSEENYYIQSATLNKVSYTKSYISHFDIMRGGKLELTMGNKPNYNWANEIRDIPSSSIDEFQIVSVPFVKNSSQTFYDTKEIKLKHTLDFNIYYSIDNNNFKKYSKPFIVDETVGLRFYAENKAGVKSSIVSSSFYKLMNGRTIKTKYPYNSQYTGGGDQGLIDQIKGSTNFADMTWQGYQGTNFEAVVNLGKEQFINSISVGFLQSASSWIWIPKNVKFYISIDGDKFEELDSIVNDIPIKEMETKIKEFKLQLIDKRARYVKIIAENIGVCPKWHPGSGGKAWIFVDEISIK